MRHKDDFSVQERGCGALRNLAMAHPDDKKGLAMTGAARVVAAASEKLWGRSDEIDHRAGEFFNALFEEEGS
jgi:hypothetical protein